jgi:hypothetical protein
MIPVCMKIRICHHQNIYLGKSRQYFVFFNNKKYQSLQISTVIFFFTLGPRNIRGFFNHLFVRKYGFFTTKIFTVANPDIFEFFQKENMKAYTYSLFFLFFTLGPCYIRGFINHLFVRKYGFLSPKY